jgi:hypothetical protein
LVLFARQGWRTFLRNHAPDIAAMDLFVVPTVGFDLLYAFVIVRLGRRELVWTNVIANPTAEWVCPSNNRGLSLGTIKAIWTSTLPQASLDRIAVRAFGVCVRLQIRFS